MTAEFFTGMKLRFHRLSVNKRNDDQLASPPAGRPDTPADRSQSPSTPISANEIKGTSQKCRNVIMGEPPLIPTIDRYILIVFRQIKALCGKRAMPTRHNLPAIYNIGARVQMN